MGTTYTIGSMLVGDGEFIREARRLKILFGGAWRQVGIMAAGARRRAFG